MQRSLLIGENLCLVLGLSSDHFIMRVMCGDQEKSGRQMFLYLHRSHFSISLLLGITQPFGNS